jgi:hypothetical protein
VLGISLVLTILRWCEILAAQIFPKTASDGVGEQFESMLKSRQAIALLDLSREAVTAFAQKPLFFTIDCGQHWRGHQSDVSPFMKLEQE